MIGTGLDCLQTSTENTKSLHVHIINLINLQTQKQGLRKKKKKSGV